jgi:DNA-binding NtrC family response regulator
MNDNDLVVCVVDDDASVREAIADLARSAGHAVEAFATAQEYLAVPRTEPPGCLVLDVDRPGLTGLELQDRLGRDTPIIFVSGHSDVPMSVRALKAGALDFLTKPFDPELLLDAIGESVAARRRDSARPPNAESQHEPPALRSSTRSNQHAPTNPFADIIGQSTALSEVLAEVRTVAGTDSTVLIHGETGTGKELIARAIHEWSDRSGGPFVKVNCGAIPMGLLESELMGHEKGAFTGAMARRIGRFELAHDGTLFLDEIGEVPLELQPKLLRVLQEREFERVGGTRSVRSNTRVIAATNRDLAAMVAARTFREDLYYRLNVFPIALPPLRKRREDIPVLAEHFVTLLATRFRRDVRRISSASMQRLTEYDWPGNIRELMNVLERAMVLARGPTLEVPVLRSTAVPEADSLDGDDLAAVNKAHILGVLQATGWVVAGPNGAAARLGVKRSTLNNRMKKLGIPSVRAHTRALVRREFVPQ